MLVAPKCYIRKCKYYKGVKWFGDDETTERNICDAFPDGIPSEIAYGEDEHLKISPEQSNKIVFEKKTESIIAEKTIDVLKS
jgi:flagellar basal body P-ring protein FlgI